MRTKRGGDSIRNPKNWNNVHPDFMDNPWEILTESEKPSDEEAIPPSVEPEPIEDIREYERRKYAASLAKAARAEMEADNARYYESYKDWAEESPNRRLEKFKLPQDIIERYSVIDALPPGVCIMGGMARSIAREVITGDIEPIRDIDLVNILSNDGESPVDEATLDHLAREYMADDYAFGHGITSDSLDSYFKTRDFTINQCLIRGDELLLTRQAYDDFQENIIRPTEYELPNREWELSSRLFTKALMMKVVIEEISRSYVTLEDVSISPNWVRPFDIALTLNKTMSRSAETAISFTEELSDWGIIPERFRGRPMQTAIMLRDYVYDFEFRPTAHEPDGEDSYLDGYFSDDLINSYHSRNPQINALLDEYSNSMADGLSGDSPPDYDYNYDGGERVRGHYTVDDYRKINA